MKTPIEMLNAIIEMQESNYGNGMNTHMKLGTLIKEAKEVVKKCSIPIVRRSFSKKDMEICWNNARGKRFDTGVTTHNDFASWHTKYLKQTK